MDQDEDDWSYSFPPSLEDLSIPKPGPQPLSIPQDKASNKGTDGPLQSEIEEQLTAFSNKKSNRFSENTQRLDSLPNSTFDSPISLIQTPQTPKNRIVKRAAQQENAIGENTPQDETAQKEKARKKASPNKSGQKEKLASIIGTEASVAGDTPETSDVISNTDTSSHLSTGRYSNGTGASMHLQPAFMLKPLPADPQTTMEDVNSIISKENHTNALHDNNDILPPMTPTSGGDFKNSIRIWQRKNLEADAGDVQPENDSNSPESSFVRRTLNSVTSPILPYLSRTEDINSKTSDTDSTPKVIAYRKGTHERKESTSYAELIDKEDRYDSRFYVKEKFKGSPYRFATIARNVEFHQIFRSHDLTDRLLDDFACALSREILLQGRIYVTEHSICFNSNLLGWVTSLVVQFVDITKIEKKSTAGLFPNGISIETKNSKHNFASFLSRDVTYEFIRTVWLIVVGKDLAELDAISSETSGEVEEDQQAMSERKISNYIMSIDEDDQGDANWNEDQLENSDEERDGQDDQHDEDVCSLKSDYDDILVKKELEEPTSTTFVSKVKPVPEDYITLRGSSRYQNNGPHLNPPTTIEGTFEDSEKETEVGYVVLKAPIGIVFDILFGVNTEFHRKVLDSQGATEVSEYGAFLANADDKSIMERTYTYRRPLGFSIGPKSTKCYVTELVEHLDYNDHIVILSITSTPDVPSGGSFTVRTRYYLLWAANNQTSLRIAFYVKWTGSSWIKNVVEKLTLSAQHAVTSDNIAMLKEEIEAQTEQSTTMLDKPKSDIAKKPTPVVKKSTTKEKEDSRRQKVVVNAKSSFSWPNNYVTLTIVLTLITMILVMFFMQWRLTRSLSQTKVIMEKQLQLTTELVRFIIDENPDQKVKIGTKNGNNKEQAAFLVKQVLMLLNNSAND